MKKLVLLGLAFALAGAVWWQRYPIFFLLHEEWNRPQPVRFAETRAGAFTIHYVAGSPLREKIGSIAKTIAGDLTSAQKELGVSVDPDVEIYVYSNWEEKGNHIRDIRVANDDPGKNALYYIVNDRYDGTRERPEYELLLYRKLGAPEQQGWGRCASAALSGTWNQKTLDQWAAFLTSRDLIPQFPAFLTSGEHTSDFYSVPWNAIFARFIKERYGWDAFVDLYRGQKLPKGYESAWQTTVQNMTPSTVPQTKPFQSEFQKGISYAYWNSYDGGYATRKSERSLDELRSLGVTWVAAIPYGFMRTAQSTEIHFAGNNIFSESDESLFALSDDARKRQMKIMMKPQLWMPSAAWTGQVEFTNEDDWQKWFDSYQKWILHYAIISELMNADLFCIGTELVQTTLKKPDQWRRLIAKVRRVYHGPIVYAANYGEEFEGITFWDALDYIGLDNYYPVRSAADQSEAQIKQAFAQQRERIRAVANRFQRPLIFTEIGYQAMAGAGMGSRETEAPNYDERMQDACYRLAMETYWNEDWFYGMYWWKWFSNPDDRGKSADPHSPHDRLAEKTLKEHYTKER